VKGRAKMNPQSFSLKPFRGEGNGHDIRITGTIERRANALSIGYALLGNLSELEIPAPGESPGRKNRLWEETCLEFFLGGNDSERYWEFNLSPAGHWNVYRFTSYREGMREEPAFRSLPIDLRKEPGVLKLSLDLDIEKIIPAGKAMKVAISAVIKTIKGKTSHWALAHPGPRPDFHRREGFIIDFSAE
jgi:hypothetical protein